MPVIDLRYPDFLKLYGGKLPRDELLERLPMLGGDLDKADGDEIAIEYFPDRPDLVSVEGIARAMRAFTGRKPGLVRYELEKPDGKLKVDPAVGPVRPLIVMCRIEGLPPLDDDALRNLMDFQERLGHGIGRRRKRVAIGIHDAAEVKGPYRYTTVDGDFTFHPLQSDDEMTVTEVLTQHPKGKQYAHLLPENGPYPAILDADGHLLSLPPVINGTRTELRAGTENLLVDLTGPDMGPIRTAMAILATAFAERGARIVPFQVSYPSGAFGAFAGQTTTTPDLAPTTGQVRRSETERVLGFGLDRRAMVRLLRLLGHDAKTDAKDKDLVHVESPAWRADLLHEWDLIEDIAKGFGYANVEDDMPDVPTFGRTHPSMARARMVRTALVGQGLLEATTLTISSEADQYDRFRVKRPTKAKGPVLLTNPITEDHTVLRTWLTPSLFTLLAANRHRDYPQSLFEVGQVVRGASDPVNAWRVAVVHADAKAGFTRAKGMAEGFLRDLGIEAELKEDDHPAFIDGRVARYVRGKQVLGRVGEFHPEVLEHHELRIPVVGFEFDLDALLPQDSL